jgi:hypothetical protein
MLKDVDPTEQPVTPTNVDLDRIEQDLADGVFDGRSFGGSPGDAGDVGRHLGRPARRLTKNLTRHRRVTRKGLAARGGNFAPVNEVTVGFHV